MAAANPTFEPLPTLDARPGRNRAGGWRLRPVAVVCLLFIGLGLVGIVGVARRGRGAAEHGAAPFMAFAVGDAVDRLAVVSEPGGGETVALLPAGARVGIAGRVAFEGAWSSGVSYWISADVDGHTVRGFVPAGGIAIQAGDPPPLDLDAVGSSVAEPPSGAHPDTIDVVGVGLGAARVEAAAPALGQLAPAAVDAATVAATATDTDTDAAVAAASVDAGVGGVEGRAASAVAIAWMPETVRHWAGLVAEAAQTHGVAADLLAIVMLVESGGHPAARSHVGATGLMQVMPATAADIARQRGLGAFDAARLTDPATAIDFGAWYLAQQLKSFGSADDPDWSRSVTLAAAAYNGGPGAAIRYRRDGTLPSETRHYIDWVGGMWRERTLAESPTFERWMAAGGRVLVGKAQAWLDAGGR